MSQLINIRLFSVYPLTVCKAAIFGLLLVGAAAGAENFWVAPTGSDVAPGSRNQPFKTIQRAADILQAGDVCHVRAGTYREWVQPPRGGDSESRRITYRAEPAG